MSVADEGGLIQITNNSQLITDNSKLLCFLGFFVVLLRLEKSNLSKLPKSS